MRRRGHSRQKLLLKEPSFLDVRLQPLLFFAQVLKRLLELSMGGGNLVRALVDLSFELHVELAQHSLVALELSNQVLVGEEQVQLLSRIGEVRQVVRVERRKKLRAFAI